MMQNSNMLNNMGCVPMKGKYWKWA